VILVVENFDRRPTTGGFYAKILDLGSGIEADVRSYPANLTVL
jgi:hypothetical protein